MEDLAKAYFPAFVATSLKSSACDPVSPLGYFPGIANRISPDSDDHQPRSSREPQLSASVNLQISGTSRRDQPQSSRAMQLDESNQNSDASSPHQLDLTMRNRRVGRACDECRSRKIKCDGRHPCLHCTYVHYDCTYDRLSKRSRRRSQKEVDELESKVKRVQNILKSISPDLDLDNPNLAVDMLSKLRLSTSTRPLSEHTNSEAEQILPQDSRNTDIQQTVPLETVLEVTGKHDLDEQGNWSYHGHGSSSAFLSRIGERFSNVSDTGLGKNTVLRLRSIPSIYESPKIAEDQLFEPAQPSIMLPPRDVALDLVSSALDEACALLHFFHEPSLYSMIHQLYNVDPEQYGYEEDKFLPLFYAALAVGYLFSSSERAHFGNAHAISQGEKYFVAARQMLDITECRDIWSLQAVLFMIIFLQSSAKMSSCHSYISAAIAASLQMGLHRCEPEIFDPIERETRKRIFWTIRTMETYVMAILGLPRTVGDDDIDQEFPLEVDDQYITKQGVLSMPNRQISTMASFNAHSKLGQILGKITTNVYPAKRMHRVATEKPRAYVVSDSIVREVEMELQQWARSLPMQLRLGGDSPQKLLRVQHLLRLAFTHAQLVLYRPFLHYISCNRTETTTSGQCYAYAAACVDVGRNVIHNAREMKKHNMVAGPYWFSIYTTFCATLALVFFVWENADVQGALQTLKDAEYGRDILVRLSSRSMAAARHSETLATIFNRLPEKLGKIQRNQSKVQKKRQTPLSNQDEDHSSQGNKDIETACNLSEYLLKANSSTDSQASTQGTDAIDLGDSPPLEDPLNPMHFSTMPERQQHSSFARFLGPDSIEELFRSESEYSGDDVSPNVDSSVLPLSQQFVSLDQFVSTLDMQKAGQEQERPLDIINDLANDDSSSLIYTSLGNSIFDTDRVGPFVPLSPYLIQMYTPSGNHLVPPEGPGGFLADDYFMVNRND